MVDEATPFSSEQIRQMSETMFTQISTELVPKLLDELRTFCMDDLCTKLKTELMKAADTMVQQTKHEIREQIFKTQHSKDDAKKFMTDHKNLFNKYETERDDAFWKATRYYELQKLYQEGLQQNPVYVPRKFRRDKYHVVSADELSILQTREVNDLKSEMDIFQIREERNRRKIELQDDLVAILVNDKVENPYLREEILRTWNQNNCNEMKRVIDVWKKKVSTMKNSYVKDKEFIREHNRKRLREQSRNHETERNTHASRDQPNSLPNATGGATPIELTTVTAGNENRTNNVTNETEVIVDQQEGSSSSSSTDSTATVSTIPEVTTTATATELEDVDSDENFSDDEDSSRVLFENTTVQLLADLGDSDEDDDDVESLDEDDDGQSFRQGQRARKKKKPRTRRSYSPTLRNQRRKSSTSRVTNSQRDK